MEAAGANYITFCKEISGLRSHNMQICGFWIVAALLTAFIVLKLRSC
jgi:hypothetical protein